MLRPLIYTNYASLKAHEISLWFLFPPVGKAPAVAARPPVDLVQFDEFELLGIGVLLGVFGVFLSFRLLDVYSFVLRVVGVWGIQSFCGWIR